MGKTKNLYYDFFKKVSFLFQDCLVVAKLIGMKLLVTEFPAFDELGKIKVII